MATHTLRAVVGNVAAGSDKINALGRAPVSGVVIDVQYTPSTVLTGANTDSRTCSVLNGGAGGTGTTSIASQAFLSGTSIATQVPGEIPLSGIPANLIVAKGDVLQWKSLHVGATGLADPGGTVEVVIQEGLG